MTCQFTPDAWKESVKFICNFTFIKNINFIDSNSSWKVYSWKDLSFIFLISSFIMLHVFLASCLYLDIFFWVIVFLNFFRYAFKKIFIWFVFQFSFLGSMFQKNWQTIKTIFFTYTLQGIKSVRFSSKIKSKYQERFSVIYTELATKPKFHRTATSYLTVKSKYQTKGYLLCP